MSERDLWARLTPYEIGIPGRAFADRAFAEIREEAESRGTDLMDPGGVYPSWTGWPSDP